MKSRMWLVLAVGVGACGDEDKRPIGAGCGESAQCESGLCLANECVDPAGDADMDGLTNGMEAALGSDYRSSDTDGDGVTDGDEHGPGAVAIDTDGDGIPDLLESLLADSDGDCKNDQVDATNDVADNFDPELIAELCPSQGVCAAAGATLAIACPATMDQPECDFTGVPGYGAETCDGLDNNCNGEVDEDGCEGQADFLLLNPYWTVEDAPGSAVLVPGYRIMDKLSFHAEGFRFTDECWSDALVRLAPTTDLAQVTTVTSCSDEVNEVPARQEPGLLVVDIPESTYTNSSGYQQSDAPQLIHIANAGSSTQLPSQGDVLIGGDFHQYMLTDGDWTVNGKEAAFTTFIRRGATAPKPGAWGIIGLFVDVAPADREIEYGVSAFYADVTQNDAGTEFQLTPQRAIEMAAWQGFAGAEFIGFEPPGDLDTQPLDFIVDNGAARLNNPDVDFLGALSRNGDFFMLGATLPEVGSARGESETRYDTDPEMATLELLVGVKMAEEPRVVAGHTYRLARVEVHPALQSVGIGSTLGEVTFDTTGELASLSGDIVRWTVPHSGSGQLDRFSGTVATARLEAPGDGSLLLFEEGEEEPLGVLFVSEDGRIVIWGEQSVDYPEALYGMFSMNIAVCTTCD